AAEEVRQIVAAKMVKHAGREVNVAGVRGRKNVAVDEAAGKILGFREASRLTDERGVQIHADEFDALLSKRRAGGQPSHRVADSAADIDASETFGVRRPAASPNGSDNWLQEFPDPATVVELLGEPLHFGVHDDEKAVDHRWIEDAVALGQSVDHA